LTDSFVAVNYNHNMKNKTKKIQTTDKWKKEMIEKISNLNRFIGKLKVITATGNPPN